MVGIVETYKNHLMGHLFLNITLYSTIHILQRNEGQIMTNGHDHDNQLLDHAECACMQANQTK